MSSELASALEISLGVTCSRRIQTWLLMSEEASDEQEVPFALLARTPPTGEKSALCLLLRCCDRMSDAVRSCSRSLKVNADSIEGYPRALTLRAG